MHLTTYTDYSVRVLLYAALKGDSLSNIGEIARAYGISRNHLMKVVHGLARHGYITTMRGKGGGLRLARPPKDIRMGAVVRDTESEIAPAPCAPKRDGQNCPIESACRWRTALDGAMKSFLEKLDEVTLADLSEPRSDLTRLLGLDMPPVDPAAPAVADGPAA